MPGPTDTPQMNRVRKRNRVRSVNRQIRKLKDETNADRGAPIRAASSGPTPVRPPSNYRRKKKARLLPKYHGNDPSGYGPKRS